jgi:hypothetical protein
MYILGLRSVSRSRQRTGIDLNAEYRLDLDTMSDWKSVFTVVPDDEALDINKIDIKELEQTYNLKITKIPNSNYVKTVATCSFCGEEHESLQYINHLYNPFKIVPVSSDKRVCEKCFMTYALHEKDWDHRTGSNINRQYGFKGEFRKHVTPMDKVNTLILGLEMEFEGEFGAWKELQDAHKGNAYFGYDNSVVGGNELSWNCGSYSWWKHLSGLSKTCKVLRDFGAKEGPSAGVHIHISHPLMDNMILARGILQLAKKNKDIRTLFEVVSLRKNRERFNKYCAWSNPDNDHHYAITGGRAGYTTEFRIFSCSLDENLLLTRLKFVKEFYEQFILKTSPDHILAGFSRAVTNMIIQCGKEQVKDGFVSESDFQRILQKLNVPSKESKDK